MALKHAALREVIDLPALETGLTAIASTSLIKTDQLQLLHIVLVAGNEMPPHAVSGEITMQCLQGEVSVKTPAQDCVLRAGQLVVLPGEERHAIRAVEDASLLLTLVRRDTIAGREAVR